jgi:hypothetical protein
LGVAAERARCRRGTIDFPFLILEPGTYFVDLGAIELRDLGPIFTDALEGP